MSKDAAAAAGIGSASIYSLPDERIEDILRTVVDDSLSRQTGINTLLACMRASRRIYLIGRGILCGEPKPTHCLAPAGPGNECNSSVQPRMLLSGAEGAPNGMFVGLVLKHLWLLCTVESNTVLAGSVRRLDIQAAFQHLEDYAAGVPSEMAARSTSEPLSVFDWQLRMLRTCRHLTHIGVVLRDAEQSRETGEALAEMRDLQSLTLYSRGPRQPDDNPILTFMGRQPRPSASDCERELAIFEAFFTGLGGIHPRRIAQISLRHFQIFDSPNGPTDSDLGRVVSSVTDSVMISVTHLYNFSCLRTLLGPSSQLHQLEIMVIWRTRLLENDESAFAELKGNHLTSIRIFKSFDVSGATLANYLYPNVAWRPTYPNRLFRCFPHLRQLSLRMSYGMSLEKLCLLAATSPDVERIDLESCIWIIPFQEQVNYREEDDDDDDDEEDGDERVYDFAQFEEDLIGVFDRWTALEYAHLGLMPHARTEDESAASSDAPFPTLAQWARSRRIKVEWQTLDPPIEGEGEPSESAPELVDG